MNIMSYYVVLVIFFCILSLLATAKKISNLGLGVKEKFLEVPLALPRENFSKNKRKGISQL